MRDSKKAINKSDIIKDLAKKHKISIQVAKIAVETFFDEIIKALQKKNHVQIRGFGSFELRSYKGYKGKNPQNNTAVQVKAKKIPFFKPGTIKHEL